MWRATTSSRILQLITRRLKMFKINFENLPRFLIPLFLAGSLALALISVFDMNYSIAIIIGLFVVVQLQKNQIV